MRWPRSLPVLLTAGVVASSLVLPDVARSQPKPAGAASASAKPAGSAAASPPSSAALPTASAAPASSGGPATTAPSAPLKIKQGAPPPPPPTPAQLKAYEILKGEATAYEKGAKEFRD